MTPESPPLQPLSWEEHPTKELMRLSWPMAISMLSYAVMTLVDTLFVGWLGKAELAATGLGGTANWGILCFSFGLFRGTKVLVSQAMGAKNQTAINGFIGASVIMAVALILPTWLLGWGVAEGIRLIPPDPATGLLAREYFGIRLLSAPFALVFVALREARYGLGDAASPMRSALLGNGINIGLDYLFIFVFDWGVSGAATATCLAHMAECLYLMSVQFKEGFGLRAFGRCDIAKIWQVGAPTGLQFFMEMGAFALLAGMLARMGDAQMASHVIALQVIHFSFLPVVALGEAGSVMVGNAIGAMRWYWVHPLSRTCLRLAFSYNFVCTLVLWTMGQAIATAFTDDPEVISVTTRLLWVAGFLLLFDAVNIISRSILRGTGDVTVPAFIGIVVAWICTPPLTWFLGYHLELGALGGWLGLTLEFAIAGIVLWIRLRKNQWQAAARKMTPALPTPTK